MRQQRWQVAVAHAEAALVVAVEVAVEVVVAMAVLAVAYADAALAVAVAAMVEVTDAAAAMVVAAAANLGHQLTMQFPFPQLVRVQWTAARAAAVVAAHGLQVHVHVVQQSKSVC